MKLKKLNIPILISVISLIIISCSKEEPAVIEPEPEPATRIFYMGFTPFPYDITQEAVQYVYDKIRTDADIISHHFDDGIPWPEALAETEYHQNITAEWQSRLANTPAAHKIFLSVTPVNILREGLAPYKAENGDMQLPPPWDTISFNHPDVKTAYLNYCNKIIDFFKPDYFCMGIEVNLLMQNSPGKWDAYLELHKYVYQQLKTLDPDFPIFVSLTGMDLIDGYTSANHTEQMQAFNEIIPFSDYYGISLYPFLSTFLADSIPVNLFDNIFSLSSKQICITETGYPAEVFSINGGTIVFNGSPEKQNNYLTMMLNAAQNSSIEFAINFVLRDYDALWIAIGSPDDFNKLWRDTGLYDEDGNPRISHQTWMDKLNEPHL